MEVVKVACQGSGTQDSVAVRSDNKSYNYNQIISSAWSISGLLCSGDSNVSLQIYEYIFFKYLSIICLQYLEFFFEYRLPKQVAMNLLQQQLMVHEELGILEGLE